MSSEHRKGSDSRCCNAGLGPYQWLDYVDQEHYALKEISNWLSQLTPWARAHELGEIDELLEKAERGELWDSGDETTKIKPIRLNPEIFELRHTSLSKKLRFYHGEPSKLPHNLVAVHRHIKTSNKNQQVEIEYASERYCSGEKESWQ